MAARRAGAASVTISDIQASAAARAAALSGADTLDAGERGVWDALAADPAFDVAIEAAGAAPALNNALASVEPGGRVVQVGFLPTEGVNLNRLIARELELLGSFRFVDEFEAAVAAVLDEPGLAQAITGTFAFGQTDVAFQAAADKQQHLKVMIAGPGVL